MRALTKPRIPQTKPLTEPQTSPLLLSQVRRADGAQEL